MPNRKSAWKNLRQSQKRRARNRGVKAALKGELKEVRTATAAGNLEVAAKEAIVAQAKIDRAADRGVLHRNKAARLKSRMAKALKAAKAKK